MATSSKQKTKIASQEKTGLSFLKPVDRLRWIVEFAQDQVEPNEPLTIRPLVQALGKYLDGVHLCNADDGKDHDEFTTYWNPEESLDLPMRGEDNRKSWVEKLALVRTNVRTVLRNLVVTPKGDAVRLTAEVTQQRVWEGGQLRDTLEAQGIREGLIFCLLNDLASAGKDLQRCPAKNCSRIFVRQYRQNFCSASCRHRTNFKAWYHRKKKDAVSKEPIQKKRGNLPPPTKHVPPIPKKKNKNPPKGLH
ncbi:MAG: hypothetical protein O7F12_08395 [Nitrospirae bacterium]|nr:hypothetical protein [Nitrospirota bacterium]